MPCSGLVAGKTFRRVRKRAAAGARQIPPWLLPPRESDSPALSALPPAGFRRRREALRRQLPPSGAPCEKGFFDARAIVLAGFEKDPELGAEIGEAGVFDRK